MYSNSRKVFIDLYSTVEKKSEMRILAQTDLFYLLTVLMGREDLNHDFLFARCMDVQQHPNDHIDLWSREHYKSTIITVAKTIQDILNNPEITVGIFSHTRPISKAFLRQIMREFEGNQTLKTLFPDVLYDNPKKESRQWSEESGIIVKRQTNPKEATIEAWGIVDGQPTSKHFSLMIYDDVVTKDSVSTKDMIKKTTESWELSLNLAARGGAIRYIGTRYHANDTYQTIMNRKVAIPRIFPATIDGTPDGEPVFLTRAELEKKRRAMGPYTFAAQMLQDPTADNAQGFKMEWLRGWAGKPLDGETDTAGKLMKDHTRDMNLYLFVDPAGEKKKTSDYTVMCVIGLAPDNNYYLVDGLRDRLNLAQKWQKLLALHRKHKPLLVGYEKYGMQSDIEYFGIEMQRINYNFDIIQVGGNVAKEDRIRWLVPTMSSHRFFIPPSIIYYDYEGRKQNLIEDLKSELQFFPVSEHDDVLDCVSRIHTPGFPAEFPDIMQSAYSVEEQYVRDEFENEQVYNPLAKWMQ